MFDSNFLLPSYFNHSQNLPHQGNVSFINAHGDRCEGEGRVGCLHGKGTVVYSNGFTYEGGFQNNVYHGEGTLTQDGRVTYQGEFQNGMKHGRGVETLPDGGIYEGEFERGQKHGWGKFTSSSGLTYEGEFKQDLIEGKGTQKLPGTSTYIGDFYRGLRDGKGILIFDTGEVYEGNFKRGYFHGRGVQKFSDGTTYNGDFKYGLKDGYGRFIFHFALTNEGEVRRYIIRYEGEVRGNREHGSGCRTYPDRSTYEGEFFKGFMKGAGVLTFPDGSRFEGEFFDPRDDVEGILTSPTGEIIHQGKFTISQLSQGIGLIYLDECSQDEETSRSMNEETSTSQPILIGETVNEMIYEGEVKDGFAHGRGKLTSKNGSVFVGVFERGVLDTILAVIDKNGTYLEGKREGIEEEEECHKSIPLHGLGCKTHLNGMFEEGEFQNDVLNGFGCKTYPNGMFEEGEFQDGMLHGAGIRIIPEKRTEEGQFIKGQLDGSGVLTVHDQGIYSGQFYQGQLHGMGVFRDFQGTTYRGGFKQGCKEIGGGITYSDTSIYKGGIVSGKRHGKGLLVNAHRIFTESQDPPSLELYQDIFAYNATYIGEFKEDVPTGKDAKIIFRKKHLDENHEVCLKTSYVALNFLSFVDDYMSCSEKWIAIDGIQDIDRSNLRRLKNDLRTIAAKCNNPENPINPDLNLSIFCTAEKIHFTIQEMVRSLEKNFDTFPMKAELATPNLSNKRRRKIQKVMRDRQNKLELTKMDCTEFLQKIEKISFFEAYEDPRMVMPHISLLKASLMNSFATTSIPGPSMFSETFPQKNPGMVLQQNGLLDASSSATSTSKSPMPSAANLKTVSKKSRGQKKSNEGQILENASSSSSSSKSGTSGFNIHEIMDQACNVPFPEHLRAIGRQSKDLIDALIDSGCIKARRNRGHVIFVHEKYKDLGNMAVPFHKGILVSPGVHHDILRYLQLIEQRNSIIQE